MKLTIRNYNIKTNKVNAPVRFLLICDLHCCVYGENQRDLLCAIDNVRPDAILLAGDIVDDRMPLKGATDFLSGIQGRYATFYVTGNHEFYRHKITENKNLIRSFGIQVLSGESAEISVNGQPFQILGVDDAATGELRFSQQLGAVKELKRQEVFNILLSHNPKFIKEYNDCACDLTLCGHAHGGQWIIPRLINGVFAPGQGFFPKYAGGKYDLEKTTMIVGRGLAKESTKFIPRIFNPPELAVITIDN